MVYAERRAHFARFDDAQAIVLVPGANLLYFTALDMHLSERPTIALLQGNQTSFIIPELEVAQLDKHPHLKDARLFAWSDTDGYQGAFDRAIDALGLRGKTLGVDDKTMRVFELLAFLQADPTLKIEEYGKRMLEIRSIKAADEIDAMREAVRRSEAGLRAALSKIHAGMTEQQIAELLDEEVRAAGCDSMAFSTLIQSGPNSAIPHGSVTDRAVREGDFLLIDFGGRYNGYPADITRTFVIGQPTDEMRRIHETVLAANRAAIAAIKPGVSCGAVDKAARDVIEAAGYGAYFTHRLGHGLGIEVHELPQMASLVEDELQAGMVFTVEPGIYVPGVGGVRIEDNVVVIPDGAEVLTSFPHGWQI